MESQRHAQFKPPVPLCWELRGTKHGDDAEPAPRNHVRVWRCKNTWTETDPAPPSPCNGRRTSPQADEHPPISTSVRWRVLAGETTMS
jgi:hypothetical protein